MGIFSQRPTKRTTYESDLLESMECVVCFVVPCLSFTLDDLAAFLGGYALANETQRFVAVGLGFHRCLNCFYIGCFWLLVVFFCGCESV